MGEGGEEGGVRSGKVEGRAREGGKGCGKSGRGRRGGREEERSGGACEKNNTFMIRDTHT